jgi:hypothetical protein
MISGERVYDEAGQQSVKLREKSFVVLRTWLPSVAVNSSRAISAHVISVGRMPYYLTSPSARSIAVFSAFTACA